MINRGGKKPQTRDEQDDSLDEIGHDDCRLASDIDVERYGHRRDDGPSHDLPTQQRLQRPAQCNQVNPDIADDVKIGQFTVGTGSFDGFIDDVPIFHTALTSNEVFTLYNLGHPSQK